VQLTREQAQTVDCVIRWLEIRAATGREPLIDVEELRAAVEHSALLRRLLAGDDPLPGPPPLAFGQPWYELVEQGHAVCTVRREADQLLINASSWEIIEEHGPDEFVVRPSAGSAAYLVWKLPSLSPAAGPSHDWIIERVWSAVT
jgi:hypothetical protein